jgi:predicted nucleic acid-binding protein
MGAAHRCDRANIGEVTVFAAAEVLRAVAVTDDRNATAVARAHGLTVHGTIWVLAQACRETRLTETGAANLIDMLRGSGMRLPCSGPDFPAFARKHGVL